jgi:hypothetical protein
LRLIPPGHISIEDLLSDEEVLRRYPEIESGWKAGREAGVLADSFFDVVSGVKRILYEQRKEAHNEFVESFLEYLDSQAFVPVGRPADPNAQRRARVKRYYEEGWTYRGIATKVGEPLSTIKRDLKKLGALGEIGYRRRRTKS